MALKNLLKQKYIPYFYIGTSQLFYTMALIWNFKTDAGYDILIYATGFILGFFYFVTGGMLSKK